MCTFDPMNLCEYVWLEFSVGVVKPCWGKVAVAQPISLHHASPYNYITIPLYHYITTISQLALYHRITLSQLYHYSLSS